MPWSYWFLFLVAVTYVYVLFYFKNIWPFLNFSLAGFSINMFNWRLELILLSISLGKSNSLKCQMSFQEHEGNSGGWIYSKEQCEFSPWRFMAELIILNEGNYSSWSLPQSVYLPWSFCPEWGLLTPNCQTSQIKKKESCLLSPATPGGNSCIACFVQSGGSSQWFRNIYAYGKAEVTFSQSIPLSRIRYLILKMFSAN